METFPQIKSRDAFGDAWAAYEKDRADQRYKDRPVGGRGNKVGGNASLDFRPKDRGGNVSTTEPAKSRDAIGARVGRIRKGEGERTEISHSKQ